MFPVFPCYRYLTVTSDMLTSVKKMEESLKRLKKAKSGSGATSQGLSDDDKIRLQLYLDVKQFGEKVSLSDYSLLLFGYAVITTSDSFVLRARCRLFSCVALVHCCIMV